MTDTKTPIQTALKWGLICLICSIILNLVNFNAGFSIFLPMLILLVGMIITIVCMVIPIREFRNQQEGFISFQDAFIIGIAVIGISSILTAVFSSVYVNYIDATYFERMADGMQEWADKQGLGSNPEMEKGIEELKNGKNKGFLSSILWSLVVGAIVSLIVAAIMQKKKPAF
ncbi:hypothetical protein AD998_18605 [bacterium 336/3]|nr:hypothetical protein AD998_18605 [bacterium 336/3]